mgnify:CR=1 FL=1
MRQTIFILAIALSAFGCSNYGKLLKSTDYQLKYTKANEFYENGKYGKSIGLLDQLREQYRYKDTIAYLLQLSGKCYFEESEYDYATLFFDDYVENFPNGYYAEECAFKSLECKYRLRNSFELDQQETYTTIDKIKIFTNNNPNSAYLAQCNDMLDALRDNLKSKEVGRTFQYFNIGDYRAAVVSAQNTLQAYPDIEKVEEMEFMMVKAQYNYAINSIDTKKEERLKTMLDLAKNYIRNHQQNVPPNYTKVNDLVKNANSNILKLNVKK